MGQGWLRCQECGTVRKKTKEKPLETIAVAPSASLLSTTSTSHGKPRGSPLRPRSYRSALLAPRRRRRGSQQHRSAVRRPKVAGARREQHPRSRPRRPRTPQANTFRKDDAPTAPRCGEAPSARAGSRCGRRSSLHAPSRSPPLAPLPRPWSLRTNTIGPAHAARRPAPGPCTEPCGEPGRTLAPSGQTRSKRPESHKTGRVSDISSSSKRMPNIPTGKTEQLQCPKKARISLTTAR